MPRDAKKYRCYGGSSREVRQFIVPERSGITRVNSLAPLLEGGARILTFLVSLLFGGGIVAFRPISLCIMRVSKERTLCREQIVYVVLRCLFSTLSAPLLLPLLCTGLC